MLQLENRKKFYYKNCTNGNNCHIQKTINISSYSESKYNIICVLEKTIHKIYAFFMHYKTKKNSSMYFRNINTIKRSADSVSQTFISKPQVH